MSQPVTYQHHPYRPGVRTTRDPVPRNGYDDLSSEYDAGELDRQWTASHEHKTGVPR